MNLTPVKEIRFFYERWTYPNESLLQRFSSKGDWHAADYRAYLRQRLGYYRRHPFAALDDPGRLIWDARFLLGRRSEKWYKSLFLSSGALVTGEISPQYFHLPLTERSRLKTLLPDAKLLLTVREPIDWTWSFARMSLIGNKDPSSIPDEEYFSFFRQYKEYYPALPRLQDWMNEFGEKLQIAFYDQIADNPREFLDDLCTFLGIGKFDSSIVERAIASRINPGRELDMPPRFRSFLEHQYLGIVEELAEHFGPPPLRWLESYSAKQPRRRRARATRGGRSLWQ